MDVDLPGTSEAEVTDPHNWNPLARYLLLYALHFERHPLIPDGASIEWEVVEIPEDDRYDMIYVHARIDLLNGVRFEFEKFGDVEKAPPRRVRMDSYRYNASFPGGHNLLRYDNGHEDEPDVFHRHLFDPGSGEEIEYTEMKREEFPVMHHILDEILELAPLE